MKVKTVKWTWFNIRDKPGSVDLVLTYDLVKSTWINENLDQHQQKWLKKNAERRQTKTKNKKQGSASASVRELLGWVNYFTCVPLKYFFPRLSQKLPLLCF